MFVIISTGGYCLRLVSLQSRDEKGAKTRKKTIVPFTDDLITTKGTAGKRKQIYDSTTLYIKRNLCSSHFVFGTLMLSSNELILGLGYCRIYNKLHENNFQISIQAHYYSLCCLANSKDFQRKNFSAKLFLNQSCNFEPHMFWM